MHASPAFFLSLFALASTIPIELQKRTVGLGLNGNLNLNVDVNKVIDQIAALAKPDLSEGKPWSFQQMTSMIFLHEGSLYVDCVKSGASNKGCPAEYPWNNGGCFMWLTGGGVSWRQCDKRQVATAYWDAGSSLRQLYESKPIHSSPALWDRLMSNPKRFDIINKVRY